MLGVDNATLSLNGTAVELIKDADSGKWHAKNDDGARVEHRTGGWSDDDDKEYWVVTTVDGTAYYFGRDKRTEADTRLNSTWTVPVFGNHPGERCYAPAFKDSRCQQAWRWNLDYVVDPLGNTMTYRYVRDSAAYQVGEGPGTANYNPGGYLARIEYGTRRGSDVGGKAPAVVDFTSVTRACLPYLG
ncbi:SpvB/TcaC N-terminal domain-containing protein [Actinotalea sp. C106]|uniref:SpvB/TcaC N-terminal domain-containing protein n=1 Tax=Actinotalea sp. C106 TaxID=2908644 RepID=UPI0020276F61|nr:SpvB/TcaC N-terminal domain-containing protein [Actinotalea sp. C106]